MTSPIPFPEEVVADLLSSPARAFSHKVVMDAIDVSMSIDRHLLLYGMKGLFQIDTDEATWRVPPTRAAWIPSGQYVRATTIQNGALYFRVLCPCFCGLCANRMPGVQCDDAHTRDD